MARPKTFDSDVVLDQTIDAFWARGYAGTSVADLEEATGLGRQSLYGAFGDKRQLFVRALSRYAERGGRDLLPDLAGGVGGLESLRRYLHTMVEFLAVDGPRDACLLANTILEFGGRDPEVKAVCHRNTVSVTSALTTALESAVSLGQLPADQNVPAMAHMLAAQVYGLSVLAKDGAEAVTLHDSVDVLVDHLKR